MGCKKSNFGINLIKGEVWYDIEREYNAVNTRFRSGKVLKKNMKI